MRYYNRTTWKEKLGKILIVLAFIFSVWGIIYVAMNTGTKSVLGTIQVIDKEYVRAYTETRVETETYTENGVSKTRTVVRKIYHPEEYNVTFRDIKFGYRAVIDNHRFYRKVNVNQQYQGCVDYRTWKGEIAGLWGFRFVEGG